METTVRRAALAVLAFGALALSPVHAQGAPDFRDVALVPGSSVSAEPTRAQLEAEIQRLKAELARLRAEKNTVQPAVSLERLRKLAEAKAFPELGTCEDIKLTTITFGIPRRLLGVGRPVVEAAVTFTYKKQEQQLVLLNGQPTYNSSGGRQFRWVLEGPYTRTIYVTVEASDAEEKELKKGS